MSIHKLSRRGARRLAIQAQLLDATPPGDLVNVVTALTFLQLDPTSAIAPSADLVAWSRLKGDYHRQDLRNALEKDRSMFEYRAMVRPMADLVNLRPLMDEWPREDRPRRWLEDNAAFRGDVLERLRHAGPLLSREIEDTSRVPWPSTGWTNNRNVTQMLEFLAARGEVAVSARQGRQRVWDLAERVYPETPRIDEDEALRRRNARRLASLGIARERVVGDAGEAAEIEGVAGRWRVDPSMLDRPFEGRTALLSPFDRLIHDRRRALDLFDFEYKLEMYSPKEKRRWGYFALPILHRDRLIGKLDATVVRREKVLRVNMVHRDAGYNGEVDAAVNEELRDLASWLEVDLERRQPLAGPAQPSQHSVEVLDEQVTTEEVRARYLVGLERDARVVECSTEFTVAFPDLPFGDGAGPVDPVRGAADSHEHTLAPVAFDALHGVVGADPRLVPWDTVDGAAGQFHYTGGRVRPVDDRAEVATQAGRTRVRAHGAEVTVVLRGVLHGAESTHGEAGRGATVELGEGAEVGVDPGQQLAHVERFPVAWAVVVGHRVAVPTGGPVGHDDDDVATGREADDVVVQVEVAEIAGATVEQVQNRVALSAGVVAVGQEDVDARVPADLVGGEPVVLKPTAVLVTVHNAQTMPVAGGVGSTGDGHSTGCDTERGHCRGSGEQTPPVEPGVFLHVRSPMVRRHAARIGAWAARLTTAGYRKSSWYTNSVKSISWTFYGSDE